MIDKAGMSGLFAEVASRLPGGICCRADWKLLYANAALERFLAPAVGNGELSFSAWLASGQITELGYPEDSPQSQASETLLFRDARGKCWLITLANIGKDLPDKLVSFVIQSIPASLLYMPQEDAPREIDSILDFIHDGIWIIDGQGITLRINKAMERIAGIKSEEVVGRHVSEPLREGRFKTCVSLRALRTRQTVTLFDDYSNGKRCLNTSTPIFDANGNVWRVIAAIRDITELENLQKRLSNLEVEALAYKLRAQGLESQEHSGLLGQSPLLQRILQDITKAAQSEAVTLILGETGTGKSLAAKTIHDLSGRAQKPFVTVNCGAIPAALMESELFGYEKGAFTGASRGGKPGMLELASGGTLLLDEIGELSLPLQAKLLHLLDGQPIYRVGGTKAIAGDARIIAATNQSLDKMVAEGRFRQDLFYRLRVLCVDMPPLRARKDDILFLAWHFLQKIGNETGIRKKLDNRAEQLFLAYSWPGNVRELQSVIQSLATLCSHDIITPADLPAYMREKTAPAAQDRQETQNLPEAIASLEKDMLAKALAETGSTYKAARRLGISQSSVVRKARRYGISAPQQHVSPVWDGEKFVENGMNVADGISIN